MSEAQSPVGPSLNRKLATQYLADINVYRIIINSITRLVSQRVELINYNFQTHKLMFVYFVKRVYDRISVENERPIELKDQIETCNKLKKYLLGILWHVMVEDVSLR